MRAHAPGNTITFKINTATNARIKKRSCQNKILIFRIRNANYSSSILIAITSVLIQQLGRLRE